ncbi:MAG TPA: hypothetical protein VF505_14320 [Thermoanaerobaculia bacterium]
MRKLAIVVLIVAFIAGALALYLEVTTPKASEGVRFPLTQRQRELLASVPANADTFALIPAAAVVRAKLIENPITRAPISDWAETAQIPRSWMIGGADLVLWRGEKATSYAIHLDPLRAAVVRIYLMFGSGIDARVTSGTFLINAGAGEPLGLTRVDQLLAGANGLGAADAIVVQQGRSSNGYPPIGRPSVTAIQIGKDDVNLVSVAPLSVGQALLPVPGQAGVPVLHHPRFPANALLAATFRTPPRVIGDLDRLFLARVSHLLDNGGSIVLYDVNARTLLPHPDGLIVAKNTPENQALVKKIEEPATMFGEIRTTNDQLLVAFDKNSMQRYAIENFVDAQWPSNDWAVRLDPKRAVPLLEQLGDNTGLRLAAPRIYRSARDLRRWIGYLSAAQSIEASHSVTPASEELRVRIASK